MVLTKHILTDAFALLHSSYSNPAKLTAPENSLHICMYFGDHITNGIKEQGLSQARNFITLN
jgi:hypothetical protein